MKKAIVMMVLLFLFVPCLSTSCGGGQGSHLETGFLYIQTADNFSTRSDSRINNLDEKADSESFAVPVILFNLSAGYGREHALYFKSDTGRGAEFGLSLGTVISLGDRENILDLSVVYAPFEDAWKNPYLTGRARQETDVTKYSGKALLSAIGGTPLGLRFKVTRVDVEDDEIGRLDPSLAREGNIYEASVDYRMELTPAVTVTPSLTYERGDFDGSSNSYDGYGASLQMMYRSGSFLVMPIVIYSFDRYDEEHPLFDRKREDNRCAMFLTARMSGLFGSPGLYCTVMAGYAAGDSTIDFCDSEGTFAGVTVGYSF